VKPAVIWFILNEYMLALEDNCADVSFTLPCFTTFVYDIFMKKLTHVDKEGRAKMVDVSKKPVTRREAIAQGSVYMKRETLELIKDKQVPKGDVLCVSRIAGILAAKKTSELIPMCHPLNITSVDIDFDIDSDKTRIGIEVRVRTTGRTGVEMEAMIAVSTAALTIYDTCKAVDKEMIISEIMLIEKRGGRSGLFRRK
jgi:cyclic pyranopterin phosphate synthase